MQKYNTFIFFILIFFFIIFLFKKIIYDNKISKKVPNINFNLYKLFYTDQKNQAKNPKIIVSKLLISYKYNLVGKPDYIYKFKYGKALIPVELKSGRIKDRELPNEGDFLQLITYFVIIEEFYGVKPKVGFLVYSDYMFRIPNKNKYKKRLFRTIDKMDNMLKTGKGNCLPSYVKCRNCICKDTVCEYQVK